MSRQAEHRKKRRELGLCAREGCLAETGDSYLCAEHGAEQTAYTLKWRRARQERLKQEHDDDGQAA